MDVPRFITEAVKRECWLVSEQQGVYRFHPLPGKADSWDFRELIQWNKFIVGWSIHGFWHARRLMHLRKPTMERIDIEECHLAESMMDESRWFAEGKI